MGRKENKRKKYFKSAGKKVARIQHNLEVGMKGFLMTCANNRERDCVRDAYSVLNIYADKLYGPEKQDEEESEDEDPDVALQQEVEAIKSASKSTDRRFQAVGTKCKNVVFVKTLLDNPEQLLDSVLTDVRDNKNFSSSQICRIMPVVGTCKANLSTISEFAEEVLEPFFTSTAHSFSIFVKVRNNSSITRGDLLPVMGHVIKSMNPGNSVDLGNPDLVVSFDILTNVACISVMREFEKRCKYNLQELTCKLKLDELKEDDSEENEENSEEKEEKSESKAEDGNVEESKDESAGDQTTKEEADDLQGSSSGCLAKSDNPEKSSSPEKPVLDINDDSAQTTIIM